MMFCRFCRSKNLAKIFTLNNIPSGAQVFSSNKKSSQSKKIDTLNVFQCMDCSLVQLQTKPVPYYKRVITAATLTEDSKDKAIREWKKINRFYNLENKSLIEIGCGTGDFIDLICNTFNCTVTGLEFSKDKKTKKNIHNKYLFDFKSRKKYDVVVCNNFLEHQPKTKDFILGIVNLVKDDGLIYISVPNFDYILDKGCVYEFVPDHLVYFTEKTLINCFENSNIEIIKTYKKNNSNDIVLIGKKRGFLNLSKQKVSFLKKIQHLKSIINKNHSKNICIWGAGHRSLTLMSIANAKQIKYVVDSAPFKQKKYTPVLSKKIISPYEFLKTDCSFLIIMLPGIFSSEVKKFLKNNGYTKDIYEFTD